MSKLGMRGTVAIAVVTCLVVLLAGWFFLVQPVRSQTSKLKSDTVDQLAQNDSDQLKLQVMRAVVKRLPQEQAAITALQAQVPAQVELPAILRSMQTAAERTGVSLTSFTPGQPVAVTAAPGIAVVSVSINATGGYSEIEEFFATLESMKRTFIVSSFGLTGGGGSSTTSSTASTANSSSTSSDDVTAAITGGVLVRSSAIVSTASPTATASATPSSTSK